ncbi:MAG: L,D-transpeptidase family protein [Bdellovibrionaceae bacterium]|nr:L,D-transpeptidase family protein [Pseudobdellovibrionaceae bacterium]
MNPMILSVVMMLAAASTATAMGKKEMSVGQSLYVGADSLNFRKDANTSNDSVVGKLVKRDQVQVLALLESTSPLVKVKIQKSASSLTAGTVGFVAAEYLSKEAPSVSSESGLSKYIVIQNVATERTRIYERCTARPGCPHKMIMETEFVAGRTEGDRSDRNRFITWLGRYKITGWKKFYEDNEGHYPSWYHPEYPQVPYNPSNAQVWFSKSLMPNGQGNMRGAFGWYTAFVGPNANSQWIHGTVGWGAEGDRYIRYTRNFWVNIFSNPRSAGCTRVENRAIAYMREILGPGTEVVRVYALESYMDSSRSDYADQAAPAAWNWILTTEGVQQDGPKSSRSSVLARGVPRSRMLETGVYAVDRFPDAQPLDQMREARSGKSGNTYSINPAEFQGRYLVDAGLFVNYRHPGSLPRGGFQESQLPDYLRTR